MVCREIGCPNGATAALDEATFGPGTGSIWLDNIHCTGNELYLSECVHDGWAAHDCDHSEDAAVQCNKTGTHYIPYHIRSFILGMNFSQIWRHS